MAPDQTTSTITSFAAYVVNMNENMTRNISGQAPRRPVPAAANFLHFAHFSYFLRFRSTGPLRPEPLDANRDDANALHAPYESMVHALCAGHAGGTSFSELQNTQIMRADCSFMNIPPVGIWSVPSLDVLIDIQLGIPLAMLVILMLLLLARVGLAVLTVIYDIGLGVHHVKRGGKSC